MGVELRQDQADLSLNGGGEATEIFGCWRDGYGGRPAARLIGLPAPCLMTRADGIWGVTPHCPEFGWSGNPGP